MLSNIKNSESKNNSSIKSFFNKVGHDALFSITENNDILSKLKKDIIIQYLIDKGLFNNRTDINLFDSIKILNGVDDEEFAIKLFDLDFKEIELKNGKKFHLDKEMIIQYLQSETIISAILKILNKFKDEKINAEQKVLKYHAEEYINKTYFYSINLSDKCIGFTIYNKNVFLNDKYIKIAFDKKNKKSMSAIAIILTTIFHEYINYLIRVLSNSNNTNNFFLKTKYLERKNDKIKMNESGNFFNKLLLMQYNGLYSIDSDYLLDIKNYNIHFNLFHEGFDQNHIDHQGELDDESFLIRSIYDDSSFLIRPKCLFSFFVDD